MKSQKKKECPFCKISIPEEAMICPKCKNDLSIAGNVGTIFKGIGGIIIMICIAVPIIMFICGMCSIS